MQFHKYGHANFSRFDSETIQFICSLGVSKKVLGYSSSEFTLAQTKSMAKESQQVNFAFIFATDFLLTQK